MRVVCRCAGCAALWPTGHWQDPAGSRRRPPHRVHVHPCLRLRARAEVYWRRIAHGPRAVRHGSVCFPFSLLLVPHTHTRTFNGSLSRTTWVSRYQKGKNNLDFTEARDSEWQWHQLGHMQVCTLLQTDNPTTQFFTGRMPFLSRNQQRQSTEGY